MSIKIPRLSNTADTGDLFMQNEQTQIMETQVLKQLMQLEDLAEKKVKIYSRLLTDPSLSGDMERLALLHESRKEKLYLLIFGEKKNKKGQGMSKTNGEGEEK